MGVDTNPDPIFLLEITLANFFYALQGFGSYLSGSGSSGKLIRDPDPTKRVNGTRIKIGSGSNSLFLKSCWVAFFIELS